MLIYEKCFIAALIYVPVSYIVLAFLISDKLLTFMIIAIPFIIITIIGLSYSILREKDSLCKNT